MENNNTIEEEKQNSSTSSGSSLIMTLTGDAAKAFEKYDSEPLSQKEEQSLEDAKATYRKYCKQLSEF